MTVICDFILASMKRLLSLSYVLVTLLKAVFAQEPYMPILGNSTSWEVVSCNWGCVSDVYHATDDTIVDGKTYKILDGYHYISRSFLLREDVNERKVYLKLTDGHVLLDEYPLYDFSLGVGDTTQVYNPISPMPEDAGAFVLDSIVPRSLLNAEHRFFYLHAIDPQQSSTETTVWVEGIGSLTLINSPGWMPTEENHLACQYRDGMHQYADLDSIGQCSPFVSSIGTVGHSSDATVILIGNTLEVRFTEADTRLQLRVHDMAGRDILEAVDIHKPNSRFDLSAYTSGIYVCTWMDEIGRSGRLKFLLDNN